MRASHEDRTARVVTGCLAALAPVALVVDRWIHVVGALPYVLLLACPRMHLMHDGHGGPSVRPTPGDDLPQTVSSPEGTRAGGHP
jgi:hypothetical protein